MEDVKERLTQLVKLETYNNAENDIMAQVCLSVLITVISFYSQWCPENFCDCFHSPYSLPLPILSAFLE